VAGRVDLLFKYVKQGGCSSFWPQGRPVKWLDVLAFQKNAGKRQEAEDAHLGRRAQLPPGLHQGIMDDGPQQGPRQGDSQAGTVHNNKMERMNGEVRDREKVMRGLKNPNTPVLKGYQICHNFVRPHEGLKGKTPSWAAGITVEGENKWLTSIQNAAHVQKINRGLVSSRLNRTETSNS
jgi:hypothetical protein